MEGLSRPGQDSKRFLTYLAGIAALVFAAYFQTLFNKFNFDTPAILIYNEAVHGISLDNIIAVFTSLPNTVEYLPVRDLSYMIDYEIWGLDPMGYHLSNIVYHAAACMMFFLFMNSCLKRYSDRHMEVALAAAALFALHPLHAESVAGIAQRKDLLSGMFFFLGLYVYEIYTRRGGLHLIVLTIVIFALAMLSKGTAVVLPFVALLIDICTPGRPRKGWLRDFAILLAAAAVMTVCFIAIANSAGVIKEEAGGFMLRIPTALRAAGEYLRMLVLPYPLLVNHEFSPSAGLFGSREILAYLLSAAVLVLTVIAFLRSRVIFFCIGLTLICMIPVIGLLPTSTIIAERYMYLSVSGPALLASWLLVGTGPLSRRRITGMVSVVLLVCAFLGYTYVRTLDWRTNETLLLADLKHNPDSYKVNRTLGRYYFMNRKYDEAFRYFEYIKKRNPDDWDYEFHLAMYYMKSGDLVMAQRVVDEYDMLDRDFVDIYVLQGMISRRAGRTGEARSSFNRALESKNINGLLFKRQAKEGLDAIEAGRNQ